MTATNPGGSGSRGVLVVLAWNSSGAIIGAILQLCYTAYTARMVSPGAYGAYAVATTLMTLLAPFACPGLGTYLLRAERLTQRMVRTAWKVSAATGAVCCAVVQAVTPLCVAVWDLPDAGPLLRLAALQALVQPAAAVAVTALRRLGQGRFTALTELVCQAGGMATASALLALGWTPYGLAVAPALGAAYTLVVSGPRLHRAAAEDGPPVPVRSMLGLSGAFAGYSLIQSLTLSAPLWAVTRGLGATAAGQFSRATLTTALPGDMLFQNFHRAVTPALARRNGNGLPLGPAVRDVLSAASALAFVFFGAIAGAGPSALRLLLGPGWETACTLVPVLALGAAFTLLYNVCYAVDEVRKAMGALLRIQVAVSIATVVTAAAAAVARDLTLLASAVAVGTGLGHLLQLRRWYRDGVVPPAALARPYLVHTAVGAALWASGSAGASLGGTPLAATGCSLLGMLPVALVCLAARRRMPLYATAVQRGLVSP
ncbi:oligosaccharide flippase family protein [Streptomyces sp. HUAS MG47]|uniref:oligosaccharide flippase family protein n=1 Tax=Streptomyces solicamelliae TaxID=3231716 RepID=UPI003877F6D5